jgi:hypothetical protein
MSDLQTTPRKEDSKTDPRGHTKATVEYSKDSQLTAKLKRTEVKFGIETGVRFKDDGQYIVSVTFYPKPKFYIQKLHADNTLGEASELGPDEYKQTWGLRL